MPRHSRDDNIKADFTQNAYGSLAKDSTQACEEKSKKNIEEVLLLNDFVR
jgi:hypothetical protein